MRSVVVARALFVSCLGAAGACLPIERDEFVPVRVPVCHDPGSAFVVQPQPGVATAVMGEAPPVATGAAADPCDVAPPPIATCTPVAYVRVGELPSRPECFLDTQVSSGEVGRVMKCPSSWMVVFAHAAFVGQGGDDYVDVCKSTTYDFPQGDDCTWRTEQRLQGSLSPSSSGLSFSYNEAPVAGRDCTLACRIHADVDVLHGSY
jgi:hypothetical protein